jgi:hypothetical protein
MNVRARHHDRTHRGIAVRRAVGALAVVTAVVVVAASIAATPPAQSRIVPDVPEEPAQTQVLNLFATGGTAFAKLAHAAPVTAAPARASTAVAGTGAGGAHATTVVRRHRRSGAKPRPGGSATTAAAPTRVHGKAPTHAASYTATINHGQTANHGSGTSSDTTHGHVNSGGHGAVSP